MFVCFICMKYGRNRSDVGDVQVYQSVFERHDSCNGSTITTLCTDTLTVLCLFTFLSLRHQSFDGRLQLSTVHQAALRLGQKEAQTLQELHGGHPCRGRGRRGGNQGFEHLPLCQEEVLNHAPEGGAPVSGQLLHQPSQPLVRGEETDKRFAHAVQPASASRAQERRPWVHVTLGSGHAFWV